MTDSLFRRKPIVPEQQEGHALARTLGWPHLIALGVGAIVGTGILTLIGVGADKAGPAVILSFGIAGLICACAALAYAEMATMIPASGSAYTYSYVVIGELLAWVVGWSLILEYSLVVSAVAVGWSGYAAPLLEAWAGVPMALMQGPELGGVVNVPAIAIIAVVAGLLLVGTRESAIFFAFYGFDAIATAAEETRNPDRDLKIGIVGSMFVCVVIYIAVAVAAVGAISYARFANSPEPLALILRELGSPLAAQYLAVSAIIALPTVILAFFYGQSRIFFTMARDGLLPASLAKLSSRGTPVRITIFTALVVAVLAGFIPLGELAALANAGTLAAFTAVSICMLIMRRRAPDAPRTFRAPMPWVIGSIAVLGCVYLFFSLPAQTQLWFFVWNVVGLGVYFLYARRHAVVG
jgi:APA family basic amino acid/polyamine antiporter